MKNSTYYYELLKTLTDRETPAPEGYILNGFGHLKPASITEYKNMTDAERDAYKAANDAYKAAKAEADKYNESQRVKREICKHNIKSALFSECLDAALDILGRYTGKSYGPKTADKIENDIFVVTGCRCRIYQKSIAIYPGAANYGMYNNMNFEILTRYDDEQHARIQILSNDNKINALSAADFSPAPEIIPDIDGRAAEIITAFEATKAAFDAYNTSAIKYRELLPGYSNIPRLYNINYMYDGLFYNN